NPWGSVWPALKPPHRGPREQGQSDNRRNGKFPAGIVFPQLPGELRGTDSCKDLCTRCQIPCSRNHSIGRQSDRQRTRKDQPMLRRYVRIQPEVEQANRCEGVSSLPGHGHLPRDSQTPLRLPPMTYRQGDPQQERRVPPWLSVAQPNPIPGPTKL